jgi:RNA polymerase sigma factor (sigma-70 family)
MATAHDESAAFEQFVRDFRARLRLAAVAISGDWNLADDLVQEALMILHRRWHTIEPAARTAYLRKTMTHLAAQWHGHATTQSQREQLYAVTTGPTAPWEGEEEEEEVNRLVIRAALGGLPVRQHHVVYLRYWYGLPTAEIARVLGVPAGTARSDLVRATARLETILRDCRALYRAEDPEVLGSQCGEAAPR